MKYFIRSVKYFFYFAIITTLIISVLIIIGITDGNIDTMFRGGYSAIWKIAVFFALVAAIYPKIGFASRRLYVSGTWEDVRNAASIHMAEHSYIPESETDDSMTFRCRNTTSRISKMYEDAIILKKTDDGYVLEGLRKDVIRLAAGLEYRLTPRDEA